jgi:hypothetical protein
MTTAERMRDRAEGQRLELKARRRRSLIHWSASEGFELTNRWTDVFEPVRSRHLIGGRWREVQPIQEAASKIGRFLRE